MRARLFLISIVLLAACSSPEETTETEPEVTAPLPIDSFTYTCTPYTEALQYLFLGHIYSWQAPCNIDRRIELLDRSCYDQVWLGGDLTPETTKAPETIKYLDSIFDLGKPETYWALGNHDVRNGNINWITEATGRAPYYAHYNRNGFTTIVFNTVHFKMYEGDSATVCEENQKQLEMVERVCDTIKESSQLLVLMHHIIWLGTDKDAWRYSNHSYNEWRVVCDTTAFFENTIYPHLKKVRERGIQVFCIAGDSGFRNWKGSMKVGRYTTEDDIVLLASGINNSKYITDKPDTLMKDKVLIMYHDTATEHMSWRHHDLDSLLSTQQQ